MREFINIVENHLLIENNVSGANRIWNQKAFDGRGETVGEWLTRHKIEPDENGKYVFYHATPKRGGAKTFLRKGSYLETDASSAAFFCGRDRNLRPDQVSVHKLLLDIDDIEPGIFVTLRRDIPISRKTLV